MSNLDQRWAHRTVGFTKKLVAPSLQMVRDHDGYSTPIVAVDTLLEREKFHKNIWEPAAGLHAIAKPLNDDGYNVFTSDIRRWDDRTECQRSFLNFQDTPYGNDYDVLTNPPFKQGEKFALHALSILPNDATVALLLRTQFLEGKGRKLRLFDKFPPYRVYVYSYRLPRMHMFFYKGKESSSTLSFSWFVWKVGWYRRTEIKWI
jgi:hypothetical protein